MSDRWEYVYLGDRLTRADLCGMRCRAVRRADGKCVRASNSRVAVDLRNPVVITWPMGDMPQRGSMGTMLVQLENGERCNVIGRLLRKIKDGNDGR